MVNTKAKFGSQFSRLVLRFDIGIWDCCFSTSNGGVVQHKNMWRWLHTSDSYLHRRANWSVFCDNLYFLSCQRKYTFTYQSVMLFEGALVRSRNFAHTSILTVHTFATLHGRLFIVCEPCQTSASTAHNYSYTETDRTTNGYLSLKRRQILRSPWRK